MITFVRWNRRKSDCPNFHQKNSNGCNRRYGGLNTKPVSDSKRSAKRECGMRTIDDRVVQNSSVMRCSSKNIARRFVKLCRGKK